MDLIKKIILFLVYILKVFIKGIIYLVKHIKFIIIFSKVILKKIYNYLKNLFYFSITFKINFMYSLIFSLLLIFSSIVTLLGFYYFLMNSNLSEAQGNLYINVLSMFLITVNIINILITIILGSKVSRRILKPIDIMTETVKEITINDMGTRLNISGAKDELKDLAITFNKMLDRLQESYERQNQFVSDASHELRTPIAVIQGYANLLDRWGKDDKEVLDESILAIKNESENMKDLIEKLLFLARGDKKQIKIEIKEFCLNELIEEIIKETKLIDSNHNISYLINNHTTIKADYKLLKQALRVFIDNSIKFTPERGNITISADANKEKIFITIEDTGIGISKDEIPYIFNRFYRVDKSRTKESGGNGLGLSIAKYIIDNHNGSIKVESELNKGTKIIICIPN